MRCAQALNLVIDDMPDVPLGAEPPDLAYATRDPPPRAPCRARAPALPSALRTRQRAPPARGRYVFAGYAPLSVRVLHAMAQPHWARSEETLALLPGPLSGVGKPSADAAERSQPEPPAPPAEPPASPVTLVFFIGGCTFSEIAAVRWMRRNAQPHSEYIVATTHICTGEGMLESLITPLESRLRTLN